MVELWLPKKHNQEDGKNDFGHKLSNTSKTGDTNVYTGLLSAALNHFRHQNSSLCCGIGFLWDVSEYDRIEDQLRDAEGVKIKEQLCQLANQKENETKNCLHIANIGLQSPEESLRNIKSTKLHFKTSNDK